MSDKSPYKLGSNTVTVLVGRFLILLGILLLMERCVGALPEIDFVHYTWPSFIITGGLFPFLDSFALERRRGLVSAAFASGQPGCAGPCC